MRVSLLMTGASTIVMGTVWVIVILSITPVRAAEGTAKPTIQICGIRVVGTGFKDKESEQQPFHQPQGTTLASGQPTVEQVDRLWGISITQPSLEVSR
ncbi:MAG: hypothetical protein ACUVXJ_09455 [Phycisphaerae bacterium]